MSIYNPKMDISVTEFKQRCLELIRHVEKTGKPVTITRRGKAVARLDPPAVPAAAGVKPWERLRGRGRWLAGPGERFVSEKDFRGL
jgi:prevent-host-death family protein